MEKSAEKKLATAIKGGTVSEHHTSWTKGYVSRKNPSGVVYPYTGKFGVGFKRLTPSYQSTTYCHVTYYV